MAGTNGNGERFKHRETREKVGDAVHIVGHVEDFHYDKANNRRDADEENFVSIAGSDGHKSRAVIRRNAPFMQIGNRNGFQASTWSNPDRLVGIRGSYEKGREWSSHAEKQRDLKQRVLDEELELLFKIHRPTGELLAVLSPIYSDITTEVVKPIMADLFPNMTIQDVIEPDGVFGGHFRGHVASSQGVDSYISVDATKMDGNVGLRLYSDIRMDGVIFTIRATERLKEKGRLTSVFFATPFHTGDQEGDIPRMKDSLRDMATSLNDVYQFVVAARDRNTTLDDRKHLMSYYGQFFSTKIGRALAHHDVFSKEGDYSLYACARVFAKLADKPEVAPGVTQKLQGYAGEMVVLAGLPKVLSDEVLITDVNADLWKMS